MARIIVTSKIPIPDKASERQPWIGSESFFRNACSGIYFGLTEELEGFDHDYQFEDFVVILVKGLERVAAARRGRPAPLDSYYFGRDNANQYVYPEDYAIIADVSAPASLDAFFNFRIGNNVFPRICFETLSPLKSRLDMSVYPSGGDYLIVPSANEPFYLHGSEQFQKEYMKNVPKPFRKQRINE